MKATRDRRSVLSAGELQFAKANLANARRDNKELEKKLVR
jgi:hypothetical protein